MGYLYLYLLPVQVSSAELFDDRLADDARRRAVGGSDVTDAAPAATGNSLRVHGAGAQPARRRSVQRHDQGAHQG